MFFNKKYEHNYTEERKFWKEGPHQGFSGLLIRELLLSLKKFNLTQRTLVSRMQFLE